MIGSELVSPLAFCCLFVPGNRWFMAEILQFEEFPFVLIGKGRDVLSVSFTALHLRRVGAVVLVVVYHDYIMDGYHF